MSESFDAAVVGAGPAGSIAALSLARAGVSVALLEKQDVPRDKICGDALMPDAIGLLREYGLWKEVRARGHRIESARVFAPNGTWVDLAGTFLTISRRDLDALLAQKAIEAGAILISGAEATDFNAAPGAASKASSSSSDPATTSGATVTTLRARAAASDPRAIATTLTASTSATLGYTKNGHRQELSVCLAILACGASAKTLRRFGVLLRESPSALAMRTYFRLRDDVDDTRLLFCFERAVLPGYGWIFPMGNGLFNIGVGIFKDGGRGNTGRKRTGFKGENLRHVLDGFLTGCEVPREMIRDGTPLAPFEGAPLRTALTGARSSAARLLVCGESIGATYSMTGEGIGKAMQTGSLAADHALAALGSGTTTVHDLAPYDENLERAFRRRFESYKTGQKWLRHQAIANFMVRRGRESPRVRGILEGIIAETSQPTELLSMWGLLKALVLRRRV
jgi:flavin-dependent dehydrogenase